MIVLIAAMDRNRVIGNNGQLPWHIPDDLRFFKDTTLNKTIIMGRKTFDSIGRLLPLRKTVIVTRDRNFRFPGAIIVHDIEKIRYLKKVSANVFYVVGGEELYRATMDVADALLITEIDDEYEGDAFFPAIDPSIWKEVSRTKGKKELDKDPDYHYVEYRRR